MEKDFFFNDPATTEIYTLSLHDALPFCAADDRPALDDQGLHPGARQVRRRHEAVVSGPQHDDVERFAHHPRPRMNLRSEEHTSELQSPCNLVCRLLLEKKKPKLVTPCGI